MLLVCLEIIATDYCSTIFKTHIFSLYSHPLIYIPMYLCSYPSTWYICAGCRQYVKAIRGAPDDDNWANPERHSNAVLEQIGRFTWSLGFCELRDALGGPDRARLEMHLEAMIVQTWTPELSDYEDTTGGRDQVNSQMHLEAMIKWVWSCTWRPW